MMINDVPITGEFRVFDMTTDSIIYTSGGGDIPPDVAMLEVRLVYSCGNTIYLDVET